MRARISPHWRARTARARRQGLAPDDAAAQGLALDEAHDEAVAEAVLRPPARSAPGAPARPRRPAASIRLASVSRPMAVSETRVPPGARRRISGVSTSPRKTPKRQISWVAPADRRVRPAMASPPSFRCASRVRGSISASTRPPFVCCGGTPRPAARGRKRSRRVRRRRVSDALQRLVERRQVGARSTTSPRAAASSMAMTVRPASRESPGVTGNGRSPSSAASRSIAMAWSAPL